MAENTLVSDVRKGVTHWSAGDISKIVFSLVARQEFTFPPERRID
jgi:hypothetical protein